MSGRLLKIEPMRLALPWPDWMTNPNARELWGRFDWSETELLRRSEQLDAAWQSEFPYDRVLRDSARAEGFFAVRHDLRVVMAWRWQREASIRRRGRASRTSNGKAKKARVSR